MLEPVTQLRILEASGARARRGGTRSAPPGARWQAAVAQAPAPAGAAADEAQERCELQGAIGSLPEVFRTVFVLRVVEGISGIETAAALGVHETTVRTRMYRAQRRLAPEMARRLRAAPGFPELTPERLDGIVRRRLPQLPHGSRPATTPPT